MKKEFGVLFWVHISFIMVVVISPLLFSPKVIIVGIAIMGIQFWAFDGCVLTHLEFGKDKKRTFIWYYLKKIFPNLNPKTKGIVMNFIVPVIILALAFLLQIKLGFKPLIPLGF